jgi:hypothetical protein
MAFQGGANSTKLDKYLLSYGYNYRDLLLISSPLGCWCEPGSLACYRCLLSAQCTSSLCKSPVPPVVGVVHPQS